MTLDPNKIWWSFFSDEPSPDDLDQVRAWMRDATPHELRGMVRRQMEKAYRLGVKAGKQALRTRDTQETKPLRVK